MLHAKYTWTVPAFMHFPARTQKNTDLDQMWQYQRGIVGSVLSSVPNSPSQPEKQDKDGGNFEKRSLVRNDYKINMTLRGPRDRQVANRRNAGWRMEGEPNVSWMAAKEKRRSESF